MRSHESWTARPSLDSLTVLRFLAALYVVVYHRRVELSGTSELLDRIIAHGYIGVPVFFVLSGFVLAYNYVAADGRFHGPAPRFYLARLARIYPVYLLAFVLFTPIALVSRNAIPEGQLGVTVLSSLTMTQAWTETIYWNRPGWTVSTEAFFYLVFPLLAPPLCRLSRWRGLAAIGLLWVAGLVPVAIHASVAPEDDLWLRIVKHNPVSRLPEFLVGVVLGGMFAGAPPTRRRGAVYVLVAVVGIAVATAVETPGVWALLWHNGCLAPLFGLLIYGLALRDRAGARVPWVLQRLGDASYGIYILQTPIHAISMAAVAIATGAGIAGRPPEVSSPWFVLAFVVVLGACALVCLEWYEKPARAAIRQLARRDAGEAVVRAAMPARLRHEPLPDVPVGSAPVERPVMGYGAP
jgi:peptidoglycan/LPS O-acetylase OafA/YrhL